MRLGDLSAEYESNGNPGTISTGDGDLGGKSYGCYQFAINAGVPQDFVSWLINHGKEPFATALAAAPAGSEEFDANWRALADADPDGFADVQHEYTKAMYFDPAVDALAGVGLYVLSRSEALQQVVWSRSVQYGPGVIAELFQEGAAYVGQDVAAASDADLIKGVYSFLASEADFEAAACCGFYRSPKRWANGSADVIDGLHTRFINEQAKALAMLGV